MWRPGFSARSSSITSSTRLGQARATSVIRGPQQFVTIHRRCPAASKAAPVPTKQTKKERGEHCWHDRPLLSRREGCRPCLLAQHFLWAPARPFNLDLQLDALHRRGAWKAVEEVGAAFAPPARLVGPAPGGRSPPPAFRGPLERIASAVKLHRLLNLDFPHCFSSSFSSSVPA